MAENTRLSGFPTEREGVGFVGLDGLHRIRLFSIWAGFASGRGCAPLC